jgi:integrase
VLADLRRLVDAMRPTFLGRRDQALLLVGWAGALRRSEIVALDFEHVDFVEEGMVITIASSKTDQEGEGYKLGIPYAQDGRYCPVKKLEHWINLARIESGPLFFAVGTPGKNKFTTQVDDRRRLSDRMVNVIIKRRAKSAQVSSVGLSGHSLRAGFITTAASKEAPEHMIQLHTRHRSTASLREYIRDGNLFANNPLSALL